MKAETLLDSVVFQLTPTRTRYDLVIIANGKTEKIASGLLDPFLAHLKAAEDQIAKGGYSIMLEADPGTETSWFTKDTVERFVRYVSTPEILDRVNNLESELLQINEAMAIQGNGYLCSSTVEDHQSRWTGSVRGSKYPYNGDKEKAVLLSKHGKHRRLSTGSTTQEANSRQQLLRALESRKTVLRNEQGMAFARAIAAGFDLDHMSNLILFAKSFGASRLLEACLGFVELWKSRHKNGQWLETVGAGFMPFQNEFTYTKASRNVSGHNVATESNHGGYHTNVSNLNSQLNLDHNEDSLSLLGPQYYHGQNHMCPKWASHGPPLCSSYPIQSMPYYESYPVSGSSFLSHDPIKMAFKRHSMDNRTTGIESTVWEMDFTNTVSQFRADQNEADFGKKTLRHQKSRKEVGHSGKRRSRTKHMTNGESGKRRSRTKHMTNGESGSESQSSLDSGSQDESQDLTSDALSRNRKDSSMSVNANGGSTVDGKEGDGENWHTFQKLLLRIQSEDTSAVDSSSNDSHVRGRLNKNEVDPSIPSAQKNGDTMFSDPVSQLEYRNASTLHNNSLYDESFMVPVRSSLHDEPVKDRRADMVEATYFHSDHQKNNDFHNYEPKYLSIMPERGLERGPISFDAAKDFDTQIQNGIKKETKSQDVPKKAREGLKGMGKEKKLSNGRYGLERRKLDTMTMKVKSSKLNPLADAKVRAEKLRAFKADLQKIKKEKEEEERKRLEALKKERQKRIAARSTLNNAQSSLTVPQTKARKITGQVPSSSNGSKFSDTTPTSFSPRRKLPQSSDNITQSPLKPKHIGASMTTNSSPNSCKSSKFSDMQPPPSSPLVKLLRSSKNVARSTSSPQRTIVHKPARLFPSSSPIKKSPSTDSKNSIQPTRVHSRSDKGSFSDIATSSSPFSKITKLDRLNDSNGSIRSATPISSIQVEANIARIQLKRGSTLEGSKMHNQMAMNKIGTMRERIEKVKKKVDESWRCTSNPESVQTKKANKAILTLLNHEDDPIVEKTVVILEDKKIPSGGRSSEDDRRERIELVAEHQALHAPPTTFNGGEVDKSHECKPDKQLSSYQAIIPPTGEPQKSSDSPVTENPNPTPFARAYIEEHTTRTVDHMEEHVGSERINTRACTSVESTFVEQRQKMHEKPHSKRSPKRFKDLLKFPCKGKHSSSSELDADSSAADPCRTETTTSNNVPTLKDLFSKDDHPGVTSHRATRRLSPFLPFQNKNAEKKAVA